MSRTDKLVVSSLALLLVLAGTGCKTSAGPKAAAGQPPELVGVIPLEHVEGRMDHMAFDPATHRLFIAALENHTVEVVDIVQRRQVHTIPGLMEPQGVACLPFCQRLLVCGRGDGTLRSFDLKTYQEGAWVDLGRNADNVRYDNRGSIYVGSGGEPGSGLISAVDLTNLLPPAAGGKPSAPGSKADLRLDAPRQGEIKASVELPSHPESFQIAPDGKRLFVNVPDEHQIVVIDAGTKGLTITSRWPVEAAKNFPMTLDPDGGRVIIACRQPACIVVYDAQTGKALSTTPCVGDADDLYYSATDHLLYVIGGEGFLDVFQVSEGATLNRVKRIPTAPKARTGLLLPNEGLIAVAAPHVANEPARVLLYLPHHNGQ